MQLTRFLLARFAFVTSNGCVNATLLAMCSFSVTHSRSLMAWSKTALLPLRPLLLLVDPRPSLLTDRLRSPSK